MAHVFRVPNEDKNVSLVEEENGLRMHYILPCTKDFPNIAFISKNKAWSRKTMFIPYGCNMSKRIEYAYRKLKVTLMLELALFKQSVYTQKVMSLYNEQQLYLEYK